MAQSFSVAGAPIMMFVNMYAGELPIKKNMQFRSCDAAAGVLYTTATEVDVGADD